MSPKKILDWQRSFFPLVLAFCLSGCVHIPGARPDLLEFIKVGQTTRAEVILTLGQPSGTFEHDRILTYRIGEDSYESRYVVGTRTVASAGFTQYSLVLIFDENGKVQKQSLVKVQ